MTTQMARALKLGLLGAVASAITLAAPDAEAYHPVPGFHLEAQFGGASRVYFTGSPRSDGMDCGSCHVDAPGQIRFHLSSTPVDIFSTGRYSPGETYRVTVDVIGGGEGKGLRTWMLETLDDTDEDVGTYFDVFNGCTAVTGAKRGCLQPSCTFMCKNGLNFKETCAPDGQPICSEVRKIGGCEYCGGQGNECTGCVTVDGVVGGVVVPTPWQFDFVAPVAGTGPITMYFGGVAGTSDHTSLGDDYEMQRHRICEQGDECAQEPLSSNEQAGDYTPGPSASGCSVGSGGGPWSWLATIALFGALAQRRRRHIDGGARAQSPNRRTRVWQ